MKRVLIVAVLIAFAGPAMAQQMVGPAFNMSPESYAWMKANSTYRESAPVKTKTTTEIQREADAGWAYYRHLHPELGGAR